VSDLEPVGIKDCCYTLSEINCRDLCNQELLYYMVIAKLLHSKWTSSQKPLERVPA